MHSTAKILSLAGAVLCAHSAPVSILDFGALPFNASMYAATQNGNAFCAAMAYANANGSIADGSRIVLVPAGYDFWMWPTCVHVGMQNIELQIDGRVLALTQNLTLWPTTLGKSTHLFAFVGCADVNVTGTGVVEGNGYDWWWYVLLTGIDNRPNLLDMLTCERFKMHSLTFRNSPMYHVFLEDMSNVRIWNVTVYVDVEDQKDLLARAGHLSTGADGSGMPAGIPTFPLNTDGIDVAGIDVIIGQDLNGAPAPVNITCFDDAVAVKPQDSRGTWSNCSQDMLIDGVYAKYGLGMTIGSVPPTTGVNCVRNITFRNVYFDEPIKGVYIKTNPGNYGSGIIDSVTYENMYAKSPLWWGIYIGPQQQKQPGNGTDTGCSFFYPLPNTTCPTQPRVPISNIVLRNYTIDGALLSPGLMFCNSTRPCTGFVFDGVNATSTTNWPIGPDYLCDYVSGTVRNSYPVPACLTPVP